MSAFGETDAQPLMTRVLRSVELTAPAAVDMISNVVHVVARLHTTLKQTQPSSTAKNRRNNRRMIRRVSLATKLVRNYPRVQAHTIFALVDPSHACRTGPDSAHTAVSPRPRHGLSKGVCCL